MGEYYSAKDYIKIFEDEEKKPTFLSKYYAAFNHLYYVGIIERIMNISMFCGCDYTKIYSPLFFYSRFNHSLVVANMTWHFTYDKKQTIAALFHDAGTPCFAHAIDYVLGDSKKQESSERQVSLLFKNDGLAKFSLIEDGINLAEFDDLLNSPILENQSPRLCTDRLDGVLSTCFIWLHKNNLSQIKAVYNDLCVLKNEDGKPEIGFRNIKMAEKFSNMVKTYAMELQTNRDKFVLQYVADAVKKGVEEGLFSLEDLYKFKEADIVKVLRKNFDSWNRFEEATKVKSTDKPVAGYSISVQSKRRNAIPLVLVNDEARRINEVSNKARKIYKEIEEYQDKTYGYVKTIKKV